LQRKLPLIPARTAFSWAHVDDIARGHVRAMEGGRVGESYIICGPAHTLVDALNIAEGITGVPAPRIHVPPTLMQALAGLLGVVVRVVPVPAEYSAEYLRVNAGVTYLGNNAKARRELGYDPRPLRDGLAETLQHELELLGKA